MIITCYDSEPQKKILFFPILPAKCESWVKRQNLSIKETRDRGTVEKVGFVKKICRFLLRSEGDFSFLMVFQQPHRHL
jgi:hypothetical protein